MGVNLHWDKDSRAHDLEWFGPPERNTLRPLGDVLFLVVCMNLSSAGLGSCPARGLLAAPPPFIDQGGADTLDVDAPTGGPNVTVAIVVANLSSDMRTTALLTQGGLLLSRQRGARWSSVACGVAC